jgi:hypothetical protein
VGTKEGRKRKAKKVRVGIKHGEGRRGFRCQGKLTKVPDRGMRLPRIGNETKERIRRVESAGKGNPQWILIRTKYIVMNLRYTPVSDRRRF